MDVRNERGRETEKNENNPYKLQQEELRDGKKEKWADAKRREGSECLLDADGEEE